MANFAVRGQVERFRSREPRTTPVMLHVDLPFPSGDTEWVPSRGQAPAADSWVPLSLARFTVRGRTVERAQRSQQAVRMGSHHDAGSRPEHGQGLLRTVRPVGCRWSSGISQVGPSIPIRTPDLSGRDQNGAANRWRSATVVSLHNHDQRIRCHTHSMALSLFLTGSTARLRRYERADLASLSKLRPAI